MFMVRNFLTSHAITLRISHLAVQKHDETTILRHTSDSGSDGPKPPL